MCTEHKRNSTKMSFLELLKAILKDILQSKVIASNPVDIMNDCVSTMYMCT